jgi:hypothetical protein
MHLERPAVDFPERGFFILGGFMGTSGYFDIAIYVKKYVCQIIFFISLFIVI